MKQAYQLAIIGTEKLGEDLNDKIPEDFELHGAQLSNMTQKLLYTGIQETKPETTRNTTNIRSKSQGHV